MVVDRPAHDRGDRGRGVLSVLPSGRALQLVGAGAAQVPEPRERPHRDPGSLDRLPGSAADRRRRRRRSRCRRHVANRVVEAAKIPGLDARSFLGSALVTAGDRLRHPRLPGHLRRRRDGRARSRRSTRRSSSRTGEQLDTASLVAARKELRGRIDELEQTRVHRARRSLAGLIESEQQLRTMEALQTANASLLRPASGAAQIQPRAKRTAVLGVMLGLMLGIGLAFARDALDTRVRSADGDRRRARDPAARADAGAAARSFGATNTLVMMAEPARPSVGGVPHAALQPRVRQPRPRRPLDPGHERAREGGQVDHRLQPRRHAGARRARGSPSSISTCAARRCASSSASTVLPSRRHERRRSASRRSSRPSSRWSHAGRRRSSTCSSIARTGTASAPTERPMESSRCSSSGPAPPDPGEFVSSPRLTAALAAARAVVRLRPDRHTAAALGRRRDDPERPRRRDDRRRAPELLKRPVLQELARALATCPTIKLGYVVTGAEAEPGYGYGRGYQYYDRGEQDTTSTCPSRDRVARHRRVRSR